MVTEQTSRLRTLTTAKGRSVETSLTDSQAYSVVQGLSSDFAKDLVRRPLHKLSYDQNVWLHILAVEGSKPKAPKPKPEPVVLATNVDAAWLDYLASKEFFDGEVEIMEAEKRRFYANAKSSCSLTNLFTILGKASASLKYPKVRLLCDSGRQIALRISKGIIYVADAKEYEFNKFRGEDQPVYYGKVVPAGAAPGYADATEPMFLPTKWISEVAVTLQRFAYDPIGEAEKYGKATGNCCFCGRALTDPTSTENGYGPICAVKYGLA